jgi:threonylcarbamoyladenosine tRNA methylthiotransferase MtaB
MRTFSIYTLGCKVNQYESQAIRQYLENLGLSSVEPREKPDLFVINTCCVTATASAKSRQYIQRAVKANSDAVRVVCGCLPAMPSRELRPSCNNNVHIINSRDDLPAILTQIVIGLNSCIRAENGLQIKNGLPSFANFPRLPQLTSFKGHTRAFLKVQDGCDGLCTYCIVPKVRPNVQSKPIEEAVAEAKSLVSAGHKEIVVTGVCLGAYGRQTVRRTGEQENRGSKNLEFRSENEEQRTSNIEHSTSNPASPDPATPRAAPGREGLRRGKPICDLLKELAKIEGLARIRVSSLEPGDISEELLDVFCAHKNIMPHIHLSVQSGSEAVLKQMCRPYSAAELRGKIELIKHRLDRPAITCDIIVGFPGETDKDFQETVDLAKWAGFSKMHIFPFSARAGTAGAKMKDKVPSMVAKQRAEIMRNLGDSLGRKFREQFVGETCEVLLEGDDQMSGRCERYFVVTFTTKSQSRKETQNNLVSSGLSGKGEIVKVRITEVNSEGAIAEEIKI